MAAFEALVRFWRLHPALYYALWALIGVYAALAFDIALLIPVVLLLVAPLCVSPCPFQHVGRLVLGACCAFVFFLYATHLYQFPLLPEEGIEGMVHFTPTNMRLVPGQLGLAWRIDGTIQQFVPLASRINPSIQQARMMVQLKATSHHILPLEARSYWVKGILSGKSGFYFLKPDRTSAWVPREPTWPIFHVRYWSKEWVKQSIQKSFPDEQVAALLTGLVTGEVTDRQISSTLMRFGLLHIMAVSGLHFSLLTTFFAPFFTLLFPFKWYQLPFLGFLGCYAAFLGPNPSVLRAFSSAFFAAMGSFFSKPASSINTLGLSLLVLLVCDPSLALMLSFQLSFLATGAILILYRPCCFILEVGLRRFPIQELLQIRKIEQCAVIIMAFLRSSLGLTLSVHIAMVPVSLSLFGFFPYLSLFYNLFFPCLIGVSLLLFLLGFTLHLLCSPLGDMVHAINNVYTRLVLNTAMQMPPYWDRAALRAQPSLTELLLFLSLLFFTFIWLGQWLEEKRQKEEDQD